MRAKYEHKAFFAKPGDKEPGAEGDGSDSDSPVEAKVCARTLLAHPTPLSGTKPPPHTQGIFRLIQNQGGGGQNAATRRNMRREERVTVQGPVKKQQPDGMSHGGVTVQRKAPGTPCRHARHPREP